VIFNFTPAGVSNFSRLLSTGDSAVFNGLADYALTEKIFSGISIRTFSNRFGRYSGFGNAPTLQNYHSTHLGNDFLDIECSKMWFPSTSRAAEPRARSRAFAGPGPWFVVEGRKTKHGKPDRNGEWRVRTRTVLENNQFVLLEFVASERDEFHPQ
jgi:hypothetical protein